MPIKFKRKNLQIGFLVLAIMGLGILAFPDSIILKSGETIEGKIIEETNSYVKIDYVGVSLTYWKDDIKEIEKSNELGSSKEPPVQAEPENEIVTIKIKNKIVSSGKDTREFIGKLDFSWQNIQKIISNAQTQISNITETNLTNEHRNILQTAIADIKNEITKIKALKAPSGCEELQKFAIASGDTQTKQFSDGLAGISTVEGLSKYWQDYTLELGKVEEKYNKERQKVLDKIDPAAPK